MSTRNIETRDSACSGHAGHAAIVLLATHTPPFILLLLSLFAISFHFLLIPSFFLMSYISLSGKQHVRQLSRYAHTATDRMTFGKSKTVTKWLQYSVQQQRLVLHIGRALLVQLERQHLSHVNWPPTFDYVLQKYILLAASVGRRKRKLRQILLHSLILYMTLYLLVLHSDTYTCLHFPPWLLYFGLGFLVPSALVYFVDSSVPLQCATYPQYCIPVPEWI